MPPAAVRPLATLAVALATLLLAACGGPAEAETPEDPVAAMAAGDPIPDGAMEIGFPWIGKQSLMCVGDAVERQVAFVDFTDDAVQDELGRVTLAGDGSGELAFRVPAHTLRTGHASRDEKLLGPIWLDAESHPELSFRSSSFERVAPTVWRVRGTWTMRGRSAEVEFLANVRYIPEMRNVGTDVVRAKGSFEIRLADHGVGGEYAGTPAVAATWQVDVVVLGVISGRSDG